MDIDWSEAVRDPHPLYAKLREHSPVAQLSLPGGAPVWLVTRYADVKAGLADPRLSVSKVHANRWDGMKLPPALDTNLLNMDAPQHSRIRRLVSAAFTARRVEAMRPQVAAIADRLLDTIEPAGAADLVQAYALPLPIAVIGDLLGVPDKDLTDLRTWTTRMLLAEFSRDAGDAKAAAMALYGFITELIARRRSAPGDDLIGALIAVNESGDRLTDDELLSLAFLILFAGYETSVNLISSATLLLLQHPGRLAALRNDPTGVPGYVEEVLRYEPPAPLAVRRFPVEDVELGGVRIPRGDTVLLGIAAANRDPDRFTGGDLFDPDRADGGHLTFGHGLHYCLGAALARVEGQVALEHLIRRLPGLALDVDEADLQWLPSFRTRSLVALPVRW